MMVTVVAVSLMVFYGVFFGSVIFFKRSKATQ